MPKYLGVSLLLIFPMICVRLWRLFSLLWSLRNDVIKEKDTFQRYLHTIRLETKRLSGLIDDLFQFSQLESGTETFSPELYHLDNLIIEVLQSFQLQLEESKIEVSVSILEKIPPVAVMPGKIKRVFINLIQNAIRG